MMVSSSKVVVVFSVSPAEDSSDGSWHHSTGQKNRKRVDKMEISYGHAHEWSWRGFRHEGSTPSRPSHLTGE
jgi:hypothetical protein